MAKFKAVREIHGDEMILGLEGVLDGGVDFDSLVGTPPRKLTVDCSRVLHANSSLVKVWKLYFSALTARGVELHFTGISTPIIEYMNMVTGFSCGGRVDSVDAPFFCKRCKRSFSLVLQTPDRPAVEAMLGKQTCSSCFGPAVFDEDAEEFFGFMG